MNDEELVRKLVRLEMPIEAVEAVWEQLDWVSNALRDTGHEIEIKHYQDGSYIVVTKGGFDMNFWSLRDLHQYLRGFVDAAAKGGE